MNFAEINQFLYILRISSQFFKAYTFQLCETVMQNSYTGNKVYVGILNLLLKIQGVVFQD